MSHKYKIDPMAVMWRLKIGLGLERDEAIADVLSVDASHIATWRARGEMPAEAVLDACMRLRFSMDWLVLNRGDVFKECPVTSEYRAVLARLHQVFGTETQTQLARELGQVPHSISNWHKRGAIPASTVLPVLVEAGVSLDFVFFGIGSRRQPEKTAGVIGLLSQPSGERQQAGLDRQFAQG